MYAKRLSLSPSPPSTIYLPGLSSQCSSPQNHSGNFCASSTTWTWNHSGHINSPNSLGWFYFPNHCAMPVWSGDLLCRRKTYHLPFLALHLTKARQSSRRDGRTRGMCVSARRSHMRSSLPPRPTRRAQNWALEHGRRRKTARHAAHPEVPALSLLPSQEIRSMTLRGRTDGRRIDADRRPAGKPSP